MSGFTMAPKEKQPKTIDLPIVMYHQIFKCTKGKYCVSPDQLRSDFTAILDAGFTPVFMSEVIAWVDGKGKLPEKPIVITFDDGHYNNLHYGLPIAEQLGIKFMIYPITSFSEYSVTSGDHSNPNYSHLTWEQIKTAVDSGLVEIGNHTHKMHRFKPRFGVMKRFDESDDEYVQNFRDDIENAQELLLASGVARPMSFAYPFGKYSTKARELLIDMGFRALLTCNEKVSTITQGEPECLHSLGRFNRDGDYSTEKILNKLQNLK